MLQDAIGVVAKEEMGVVLAEMGVGVMVVFWYMYQLPTYSGSTLFFTCFSKSVAYRFQEKWEADWLHQRGRR